MKRSELSLEPYEAPRIDSLLTMVEQGFAASISEGAGGDSDGSDDNWGQWDFNGE